MILNDTESFHKHYGDADKSFATLAKLGFHPAKFDTKTGKLATKKTPDHRTEVKVRANGLSFVGCTDGFTFGKLLKLREWKEAPIFATPTCKGVFVFASCGDLSVSLDGFEVGSSSALVPGDEEKFCSLPPAQGRVWISAPCKIKKELPKVPSYLLDQIYKA